MLGLKGATGIGLPIEGAGTIGRRSGRVYLNVLFPLGGGLKRRSSLFGAAAGRGGRTVFTTGGFLGGAGATAGGRLAACACAILSSPGFPFLIGGV